MPERPTSNGNASSPAALLAGLDDSIQAAQGELVEFCGDCVHQADALMMDAAAVFDELDQAAIREFDEIIYDVDQTSGTVLAKINQGLNAAIEHAWETARSAGADMPPVEEFLAASSPAGPEAIPPGIPSPSIPGTASLPGAIDPRTPLPADQSGAGGSTGLPPAGPAIDPVASNPLVGPVNTQALRPPRAFSGAQFTLPSMPPIGAALASPATGPLAIDGALPPGAMPIGPSSQTLFLGAWDCPPGSEWSEVGGSPGCYNRWTGEPICPPGMVWREDTDPPGCHVPDLPLPPPTTGGGIPAPPGPPGTPPPPPGPTTVDTTPVDPGANGNGQTPTFPPIDVCLPLILSLPPWPQVQDPCGDNGEQPDPPAELPAFCPSPAFVSPSGNPYLPGQPIGPLDTDTPPVFVGPPYVSDPVPTVTARQFAGWDTIAAAWKGKSICALAFELRPQFICAGMTLIRGPDLEAGRETSFSINQIRYLLNKVHSGFPEKGFDLALWRTIRDLWFSPADNGLKVHLAQLKEVFAATPQDWLALAALEAFLEFMASVEVTFETRYYWGVNEERERGQEAGAGVGALPPFQGGFGAKGKAGQAILKGERGDGTGKGTLRVYLIPAIELVRYLLRAELPDQVPTIEQAIAAWRGGQLSAAECECFIRLNGGRPRDYWPIAAAAAWPLNPLEVTMLRRRGFSSDAAWSQNMRLSGITQEWQAQAFWELTRQLPPMSDLTRYMVRDVEDKEIVDRFQLEAEFGRKFRGDVERWATGQGITKEVMLANWKAHWRLPGLHQAFECLHRLRPDSFDPDIRAIATTEADLEALLAQDDLPPFWRARLIAISYHPLTRIDAQRMRIFGVLDNRGLEEAYMDLGYTRSNAVKLVEFTNFRRIEWLRRYRTSTAFSRGEISQQEWDASMRRFILSAQERDTLLTDLRIVRNAATRKKCIAAIRKRFISGEYAVDQAVIELVGNGLPADQAKELADSWQCERGTREKAATAHQLCAWFAHNLITETEFKQRLIRIGYAGVDAARIIGYCKGTTVARLKDKTARDAAKRKKDLERLQTQAEREEAAKEAAERRMQRAADREAAAEARRKKKLRAAAVKLADITGFSEAEEATRLQSAVVELVTDYGLSDAEAEALAIDAVEQWQFYTGETFLQAVRRLADAEEVFDLSLEDVGTPRTEPAPRAPQAPPPPALPG